MSPSVYAEPISLAQHFNPDSRTIQVTLQGVPDLPQELGLIAADFLQNLRAALNYLVWELSRLHLLKEGEGQEPRSQTQFPIFYKRGGEWNDNRIPDLCIDHAAIVRELQPSEVEIEIPPSYRELPDGVPLPESFDIRREQARLSHPLTHLAKLTNEDKHRTLVVALLSGPFCVEGSPPVARNCTIGPMTWMHVPPHLKSGEIWGVAEDVTPTGEGEPELEIRDKITTAEPGIGACAISDLPEIGTCVADIIGRFAPAFDE